MRFKIQLGFFMISLLLCLAGVLSYVELTRLTSSVQLLIDNGAKSISLSKAALDIIQEQNSKVLMYYNDKSVEIKNISKSDVAVTDSLYAIAISSYPGNAELAKIGKAKDEYVKILSEKIDSSDTHLSSWYVLKYNVAYTDFTNSIKAFMISSQQHVVTETGRIKANMYRTTMQSVVALAVAIVLLYVFFLLMDVFYIKPIVLMTKSLQKYLDNDISFNIKDEGANEPLKLKELILVLIQRFKQKS